MNPNPQKRNSQMLPRGYVKAIAKELNCRPAYVSSIIHHPEKFSGPTAELVKKLKKNIQDKLDSIEIDR